jgi:hypothetical protein
MDSPHARIDGTIAFISSITPAARKKCKVFFWGD